MFWPYAYWDFLDYTFWPYAYDAFWPYAYDDLYVGVFGPYAYEGPAYADVRLKSSALEGPADNSTTVAVVCGATGARADQLADPANRPDSAAQ